MFGAAYCGTMLETALTKESGFRPMRRNVVMWSFPLTKMEPRISKVYHSLRTCMHLSGTWIRPCTPVIKENKIICIGLSNNFQDSYLFLSYLFNPFYVCRVVSKYLKGACTSWANGTPRRCKAPFLSKKRSHVILFFDKNRASNFEGVPFTQNIHVPFRYLGITLHT